MNSHRISISNIYHQSILGNKVVCDVNSVLLGQKIRVISKLLYTPIFCVPLLSIVIIFSVYFFDEQFYDDRYYMWFVIYTLLLIHIGSVMLYFAQMIWSIQYGTNTGNKKYRVTRNSMDIVIKGKQLNCGDEIHLVSGEDVPVDIRITRCKNLQVSNSLFSTKEVEKNFVAHSTDEDIFKSSNMIFKGSTILSGEISGIVIQNEGNSISNTVMLEMREIVLAGNLFHKCPFTNEYISLLTKCFYAGLCIVIPCNLYLMFSGYRNLHLLFITMELLAIIMTETAFVVVMMAVIIGKGKFDNTHLSRADLSASLAMVNVIFVRDVSMLCQNKYIISKLWIDGNLIDGEEVVASLQESLIQHSPTWTALTRASVLCNDAVFTEDRRGDDLESHCDEIDESLLLSFNECESVKKWGGSLKKYKENNTSVMGPTYDFRTNCMLSIHKLNDGDGRLLLVLRGSPIDILNCCSTVLIHGIEEKLENTQRDAILKSYEDLLTKNNLIRAFCDLRLSPEDFPSNVLEITPLLNEAIPRDNLRFIGMLSFTLPMDHSVALSLAKGLDLGVKVTFLNPSCDIHMLQRCKVMDASEFGLASDLSFENVLHKNCIIRGIDDKLTLDLLKFSQQRGKVVAVLGRSIVDIRALLASNIGITPSTGTCTLCKQVSDVHITNDNFATIMSSIEKSRSIMKTLYEIINFLQFPKITLVFGYIFFVFLGLPLAFNFSTILALELCLLLPSICIMYNDLEVDDNTRDTSAHISKITRINFGLIEQIGVIQMASASFSYLTTMALHGFWPTRLIMIRNRWYLHQVNDLFDSYGQEWTYAQRRRLEGSATFAVFFTLVFLQITTAICTASASSIFRRRIINLKWIASLLFSLLLAFIVLYAECRLQNVEVDVTKYGAYLTTLPFFLYLIGFTEIRKYLYRNFNKSRWLR